MKVETEQEASDVLLGCAGQCILICGFPLMVVLQGAVGTCLWNWFAVPQFGWKPIALPVAIGLNALLALYRGKGQGREDAKTKTPSQIKRQAWSDLMFIVLFPLVALTIGWLAHLAS